MKYVYTKVCFTDGEEIVIPLGSIVGQTATDIMIEEIGGETYQFIKANMKYMFTGTEE